MDFISAISGELVRKISPTAAAAAAAPARLSSPVDVIAGPIQQARTVLPP